MELSYFILFIVIGGAIAEPTTEIIFSQNRVDQNTEVTITCRVRNPETSTMAKIKKYLEIENPENKNEPLVYEEDVSINGELEKSYKDLGRFSMDSLETDVNVVEYILTITSTQREDSAVYACNIHGTAVHNAKFLEVYTRPEKVHFYNASDPDDILDMLYFDEGKTYDIGCMAMGGVPLPRIEVMVGDKENYTRKFKHYESEVIVPECYEAGDQDSCLLHFSTESEIESDDFRPYYTADGQSLECRAHIDGSDMQPVVSRLTVLMRYKPKFNCWRKHKVAVNSMNYELTCNVLSNPRLDDARIEFVWEGETVKLMPGESTEGGQIQFLELSRLGEKETDVTLKFDQVVEGHYDLEFKLFANNIMGQNHTTLELVDETYVRGSANTVMFSGALALFTGLVSFFVL